MTTIESAKAMLRVQLGQDIADKLRELREEQPALDYQQAWAALEQREPALFKYAAKIESDQWETKHPVYRYTGTSKKFPKSESFKTALKDFLPSKVEAKKPGEDEGELMLVYAADGTVADIVFSDHQEKLHQETQKLINKTPGLHYKLGEQMALDHNPDLAAEHEDMDELQKNQLLIKAWIKDQQAKHPKLSFREGWSKCQVAHPGWFEPFTP